MDGQLQKAFDTLVPKDQLIVGAMIIALTTKDQEIAELTEHVRRQLEPPTEHSPLNPNP